MGWEICPIVVKLSDIMTLGVCVCRNLIYGFRYSWELIEGLSLSYMQCVFEDLSEECSYQICCLMK